MERGGCSLAIGMCISINFLFARFSHLYGHFLVFKQDGLEKVQGEYVLQGMYMKIMKAASQTTYIWIQMKDGSIIHNLELKLLKKQKFIFH